MNGNSSKESGPVAVIAVHGVADQRKDETAVKAAKLLLRLDGLDPEEEEEFPEHGYEGFQVEKVHVGTGPLDISGMEHKDDAWHYQLREHLTDYEPHEKDSTYETVRLEGARLTHTASDEAPEVDRPVHIYEMHWADVSNLKVGVVNLFLAIYRLLFETSWLGKQTLGTWASYGDDVGTSSFFTTLRGCLLVLHSIATTILTRFMPIMYLLMICMLLLTGIPISESEWAGEIMRGLGGYPGLLTIAVVLSVGVTLVGGAFSIWRQVPWPPLYVIVALLCFGIGMLTFALLNWVEGTWWAEAGLALLSWLGLCSLVNLFVLPILDRLFPGTRIVAFLLQIYFTVALIFGLFHETPWPLSMSGPLHALRMAFALLPFAWIVLATSANLFLILAIVESFSLLFRRWLGKEVIQRRRSRIRTAILSITLPVLLISFLNTTFFQLALIPAKVGFVDGASPLEGRTDDAPAWAPAMAEHADALTEPIARRWSTFPNFIEWGDANSSPEAVFSDFAKLASSQMVVPFLEAIFLIIILVLGYSMWIVAPAVLAERNPWDIPEKGKPWRRLSEALGKNLTRGYRWMYLGQVVLMLCLLLTQALFAVRGARIGKILSGGAPGDNQPMMVLVDQFLGVHHLKDSTGTPIAEASPLPSPAKEERLPPEAEPAPATDTPPSPPLLTEAPPPSPEAQTLPTSPPIQQAMNRPFQSEAEYRRAEIRRSIEQIWRKRDGDEAPGERGVPDRPSPTTRRGPPESPAPAPFFPTGGMGLNLFTEVVLFLNSGPLTNALGFLILFVALGYVFLARLADPIVSGLRGGLDIVQDVVSYLRPHPTYCTSRARILSRYASLLKYIQDWRDPANPDLGYSRIVILTHSQGNVITSDLLRALASGTVARDNGLELLRSHPGDTEGVPIRMISMGSPLRQLYTARFPDLYQWDPTADPRETHRGLESWWNLYRSGDYVGRMIFRDDRDPYRFIPEHDFVLSKDGENIPVRETCLGPGAHTHYWDDSAPASVIRKFDCMIACDRIEELAEADLEEEESAMSESARIEAAGKEPST